MLAYIQKRELCKIGTFAACLTRTYEPYLPRQGKSCALAQRGAPLSPWLPEPWRKRSEYLCRTPIQTASSRNDVPVAVPTPKPTNILNLGAIKTEGQFQLIAFAKTDFRIEEQAGEALVRIEQERHSWFWGSHASRVPSTASRRRFRQTIFRPRLRDEKG